MAEGPSEDELRTCFLLTAGLGILGTTTVPEVRPLPRACMAVQLAYGLAVIAAALAFMPLTRLHGSRHLAREGCSLAMGATFALVADLAVAGLVAGPASLGTMEPAMAAGSLTGYAMVRSGSRP